MSRKANPSAIGAFVLTGIALVIVGLGFLGTMSLFSREQTYILYFTESINGLNIGSPVKWKGVPIGRVTDIKIRYNQYDPSSSVPVFITLNLGKVHEAGVDADITSQDYLRAQADQGLRAQLVLDSLITGLLFVELDYFPNAPQPVFEQSEPEMLEIPTIPSPLAGLDTSINEALVKIASVDYGAISDEVLRLLRTANTSLETMDFQRLNDSLVRTAESVEELMASPQLREAITSLTRTLANLDRLVVRLESETGPIVQELRLTANETRQSLRALASAARSADELMAPSSALRYELEAALDRVAAAAESVRLLTDYLERNPSALLLGKQSPSTEP